LVTLFLPDTNACSQFLRGKDRPFVARWLEVGSQVRLSAIVYAELQFGVAKLANDETKTGGTKIRQWRRVSNLIESLPFERFTAEDGVAYGRLRAYLERRGETIGPYDLLIAAQALRLRATLVTNIVREFIRVPNLKFEDWQSG
jgi:tRNA(fMet)-specific endonuclease VapC